VLFAKDHVQVAHAMKDADDLDTSAIWEWTIENKVFRKTIDAPGVQIPEFIDRESAGRTEAGSPCQVSEGLFRGKETVGEIDIFNLLGEVVPLG